MTILPDMETFTPAVALHAAAAFLVLLLGPVNLIRPQRDQLHQRLGYSWVALMYLTCASSFLLLERGLTFLHGLSVFTAVTVTLGVWRAMRGDHVGHRANMVGSYVGTLIAFGFAALMPTRLLWRTGESSPAALALAALALGAVALAWVLALRSGQAEHRRAA